MSPNVDNETNRPRSLFLRAILGMALAFFVVGGFLAGLFFLTHLGDLVGTPAPSRANQGDGIVNPGASSASPSVLGLPTRQTSDPRFAFLLMGYGGAGHDGAYLTDSMIAAIVDPSQKTISLLSIPRDIWAPLVFSEKTTVYNKINTAYAFAEDSSLYPDRLSRYEGSQGPGTFAMDTVSRLLGIPISYYLALDFAGFRQAIDTVGGIDVNVPDAFSARYPANDDPAIDPSWKVVKFSKGQQHMDGERAIEYARAREAIDNLAEGSDFARSQRQRLIMEAFKARLFQPGGLIHLPQLLALGAGHVDTNYALPSVVQFAQLALGWKDVRFYQTALTNQNYLVDSTGAEGTYILVPDSPDHSWAWVQAFAQRLWRDPELGVAMANTEVVVENDANVAGLAGRVGADLDKLGYRVGAPITGSLQSHSGVVDQTGGEGKALVRGLEADLHVKLGETQAAAGSDPARITLKIGSDFANSPSASGSPDASAPARKP